MTVCPFDRALVCLLTLAVVSCGMVKRSDDVNPLEAVVQQQGVTIQTLQAQLSALTDRLTAVETGRQQDHQKQAVFHVKFKGAYDVPLDVGIHATLKFDSVVTNVGGGYSPEHGVFTAPFSGSYFFILAATHIPDPGASSQLGIMKTGHTVLAVTYGKFTGLQADGGYSRDTVQTAVHLTRGDEVWVEHLYGGHMYRQADFTTFTGALVQAD